MQNSHVKIGALQVISKTLQKEGATAFWKGVTPPLLAEGVLNHIWFGTYAIMAAYFHPDPTTPLNFYQAFVSGGVAGGLGAIIVAPSDLIKLQSQVNEGTGKDRMKPLDVVRQIYSKEGLMGFTRGFCPALLRDVPGLGIPPSPQPWLSFHGLTTILGMFFGVYNAMKNLLRQPDGTVSGFGQIVAGGTSGIGSWIVSYPYDVIKTRMQVSKEYTSVRHCAMQAYRAEGATVFYRGMLPCLIGSFPINAIIFFIYEFLIQASWSLHAEAKEK